MTIRSNVRSGSLDQRVQFQRNTATVKSASGNIPALWEPLFTCWARVDGEKAGGERYIQDGVRSVADYTFWIRSDVFVRFDIGMKDRILWRGRLYDIHDIPDQQRRGRLIAIIAGGGVSHG